MFTTPPKEADKVILPKLVEVVWFKPVLESWSIVRIPPFIE
jgi:hypothetical protein